MKSLLKKLHLSFTELSLLLATQLSTVHGWFRRHTTIPGQHQPYIQALEQYAATRPALVETQLIADFDPVKPEEVEAYCQEKLRFLQNALNQAQLRRNELLQIRQHHLERLHLCHHLPDYLPAKLRNGEQLEAWQVIIRNSSRKQLRKASPQEILRLEQKIVGLQAEVAFLKGKVSQPEEGI